MIVQIWDSSIRYKIWIKNNMNVNIVGVRFTRKFQFSLYTSKFHSLPFLCRYLWNLLVVSEWICFKVNPAPIFFTAYLYHKQNVINAANVYSCLSLFALLSAKKLKTLLQHSESRNKLPKCGRKSPLCPDSEIWRASETLRLSFPGPSQWFSHSWVSSGFAIQISSSSIDTFTRRPAEEDIISDILIFVIFHERFSMEAHFRHIRIKTCSGKS